MPPPNHIVAPQSGGLGNPNNKIEATPANTTATTLHKFSPDAPVFVPKSLQISEPLTGDLQNDQRNQPGGKYNRDYIGSYHHKEDTSAGDSQKVSPYVKSNNQSETRGSQYHANNYKHSNNYDANRHPKFQHNGQPTDFQGHNSYNNHKSRDFSKTNGSSSGAEAVHRNKKHLGQALKKSSNIPRAPWHDVSDSPSPSPPLDDDDFSLGESSPETVDGKSEKREQENVRPDRGLHGEDSSQQTVKSVQSYSEPYRESPENIQKLNGSHALFKDKQRGQRFGDKINTMEYYNRSIRHGRDGEEQGYRTGRGSYRGHFSKEYPHENSFYESGNEVYGYRGRGKDDSHFNGRGRSRGYPRSFANNRGDFHESAIPDHWEYVERFRGRGRSDNYSSRHNRRYDDHREYRSPDFNSQESESRDTYQKYPYRSSHVPREDHRDYSASDFNRQHNQRDSYRKSPFDVSHELQEDLGEDFSPGFQSYRSERGSLGKFAFDGPHATRGGHDEYGRQDINSARGVRGANRNPRYNGDNTARGGIRRTQSERTPPSHETRQETNSTRKYEDNHHGFEKARPEHGNDEYRARANKWSLKKAQNGLKQDPADRKESSENVEAKLAKNRMNSRQKMVLLDEYNSDLNLILDANGYGASTLDNPDGFLKLWADVKATHGACKGKLYFEVKVIELVREQDVDENTDPCPHAVRVGWSTEQSTFEDGTGSWCLGYSGKTEFIDGQGYCESFQKDDVIGVILDLESSPATVVFLTNGVVLGDPWILPDAPPSGAPRALFPHISLKNSKVRVNFGQREPPWFPPPDGARFIGHVPMEDLTPSLTPPEMKSDCEIVMLIGLPGAGKTTWAMRHQRENPNMRFNILGTDLLIELLSRHENESSYHKTFDRFKDIAKSCFERLLKIAAMKVRNYIVDQTNVFLSARRRKLSGFTTFRKVAVVIQPSDRELTRRSRERTQGSNKIVPEGALREMKANFALPDDVGEAFHVIEYAELQENDARELVDSYNVEGQRNKPLLCLD